MRRTAEARRPVRVLFLDHTGLVGGAEHSLLELARGMRAHAGVDVLVACPDGPFRMLLERHGIDWAPLQGSSASLRLHPLRTPLALRELLVAARQLEALIERRRPDVVHANSIRASLVLALARRREHRPTSVAHVRDTLPPSSLSRAIAGLLARRADAIIAVSTSSAAPFAGAEVVDNAVDLGRYRPRTAAPEALRAQLAVPARTPLLLHVAQLTPWKGQRTTIDALGLLRGPGPPAHLLIVGEVKFVGAGTSFDNRRYFEELQARTAQLALADRVHFLGERADVEHLLAGCDVALLPSWDEPFGRSVAEAMAVGTPVIATNVGGPAELIEDGVDGLLVAPREPSAWATSIDGLLGDPERRAALGAAGRATATRRFATAEVVGQVLSVYRRREPVGSPRPAPASDMGRAAMSAN